MRGVNSAGCPVFVNDRARGILHKYSPARKRRLSRSRVNRKHREVELRNHGGFKNSRRNARPLTQEVKASYWRQRKLSTGTRFFPHQKDSHQRTWPPACTALNQEYADGGDRVGACEYEEHHAGKTMNKSCKLGGGFPPGRPNEVIAFNQKGREVEKGATNLILTTQGSRRFSERQVERISSSFWPSVSYTSGSLWAGACFQREFDEDTQQVAFQLPSWQIKAGGDTDDESGRRYWIPYKAQNYIACTWACLAQLVNRTVSFKMRREKRVET